MPGRLDGKYCVVTGSTQGVGLATARLLVERGAAGVAVCGRNEAHGHAAEAAFAGSTTKFVYIQADLSVVSDCFKVIDRAAEAFGRIDSLINCCGATDRGTLESTTPDLWDYLFAVNVKAPFFLIQRAVPHMKKSGQGGTIVSIGSIAAHGGQPYISGYVAAKAALVVLTKNLANALRWDRIRVNVLNMGWANTPTEHKLQVEAIGLDWLSKVAPSQPFGRLIEPEDAAKALVFLASDESTLMTGAVIDFDQKVIGTVDDNPVGT